MYIRLSRLFESLGTRLKAKCCPERDMLIQCITMKRKRYLIHLSMICPTPHPPGAGWGNMGELSIALVPMGGLVTNFPPPLSPHQEIKPWHMIDMNFNIQNTIGLSHHASPIWHMHSRSFTFIIIIIYIFFFWGGGGEEEESIK